ncbi:hypothetical protein RDI58_029267 [Solanum bulbocastanum]|uniref:Uncharacterized protein n=1 Tax=Solanum bulbocastanum TaxID=147425 RepID=A0AAN8Y1Y3_SOLBU
MSLLQVSFPMPLHHWHYFEMKFRLHATISLQNVVYHYTFGADLRCKEMEMWMSINKTVCQTEKQLSYDISVKLYDHQQQTSFFLVVI